MKTKKHICLDFFSFVFSMQFFAFSTSKFMQKKPKKAKTRQTKFSNCKNIYKIYAEMYAKKSKILFQKKSKKKLLQKKVAAPY